MYTLLSLLMLVHFTSFRDRTIFSFQVCSSSLFLILEDTQQQSSLKVSCHPSIYSNTPLSLSLSLQDFSGILRTRDYSGNFELTIWATVVVNMALYLQPKVTYSQNTWLWAFSSKVAPPRLSRLENMVSISFIHPFLILAVASTNIWKGPKSGY